MQTTPAPSLRLPATLLLALACLAAFGTGCGWLASFGGPPPGTISFASGELLSIEPHALQALDVASGSAIQAMGYAEAEASREEGRVRWQARTAGGEPVEIRLDAKDEKTTELRIRVGVLGDEARSRLLLEQVHRAL